MNFSSRVKRLVESDVTGYNFYTYQEMANFLNTVYYGTFDSKDFEIGALAKYSDDISNIDDFGDKILANVRYSKDVFVSKDYVQTADITMFSKQGDCDDFARLTSMFLDYNKNKLGLSEVGQAVIFDAEIAHALCWAKSKAGMYSVFDIHNVYLSNSLADGLYYSFYKLGRTDDVVMYVYKVDTSKPVNQRVIEIADESQRVLYPTGIPAIEASKTYAKLSIPFDDLNNKGLILSILIAIGIGVLIITIR